MQVMLILKPNKVNKLLVLQGIPGSGKTTFARKLVEEDTSWVRVNRDDLRNMRGVYIIPAQEHLIDEWETFCIKQALSDGYNVVADSTNLNPKTVTRMCQIADSVDAEIEFKMIDVEVDEAIRRDALRPNPVGEQVIKFFYNRYVAGK